MPQEGLKSWPNPLEEIEADISNRGGEREIIRPAGRGCQARVPVGSGQEQTAILVDEAGHKGQKNKRIQQMSGVAGLNLRTRRCWSSGSPGRPGTELHLFAQICMAGLTLPVPWLCATWLFAPPSPDASCHVILLPKSTHPHINTPRCPSCFATS